MSEIELKLLLDAEGARALRAAPALSARAEGGPQRRRLRSIYYDTPGHALRAAGLALRLRKAGRGWVQTVKAGRESGALGLHSLQEAEAPAPGGRLDLARIPDEALRAAVEAACAEAPLAPVFETDMTRTAWDLATPLGAAELALDEGEIVAGEARAPFREAELELTQGAPAVLYDLAGKIFAEVPFRFSERSKAARGFALAAGAPALPRPGPVKATDVPLDRKETTEAAAARILRACLAQIDANAAACLETDDPEGPHQLRTGLRRLRSAFSLFGEALAGPALDSLKAGARDLGREAGRLRDLDVVIDEILRPARGDLPRGEGEAAAFDSLLEDLRARREEVRAEFRQTLRGPQARRFLLELSAFVELQGWRRPTDAEQTRRLARPVAGTAARALSKRRRKVRKLGRDLDALDVEGRHALRKELKKLRYAVTYFGGLWPKKRAAPYLKALKRLQKGFGALNDGATAEALLCAPDAPRADDPLAQRAVGRLLGRLEAQAEADWARTRALWTELDATPRFWK
jgi:inorganic triphosphatase YgiF